jgi:hypothetical protein
MVPCSEKAFVPDVASATIYPQYFGRIRKAFSRSIPRSSSAVKPQPPQPCNPRGSFSEAGLANDSWIQRNFGG